MSSHCFISISTVSFISVSLLGSYVHTETQDGKGSIDSHFAVSMRHILNYINMGSNVVSPLELYSALQSNGGVGNSVATLFDLDCGCIGRILTKYKRSFDYFTKIKSCNEIIYKDNSLLLYYYSNITPVSVNLSDISNPVGEVTYNDKSEEESEDETQDDEDSVPGVIIDELGDEHTEKRWTTLT